MTREEQENYANRLKDFADLLNEELQGISVEEEPAEVETEKKLDNSSLNSDELANYVAQALRISLKKSVNANVKVENKRKKIPMTKKTKKLLAIGACTFGLIAGLKNPKVVDIARNATIDIQYGKLLASEEREFSSSNIVKNTHHNISWQNEEQIESTTWYDYNKIFQNAKYQSPDPVIAFYLSYELLGESALNRGIAYFNNAYGTNYENVNDFLNKNGFTNETDWKAYVGKKMFDEKEASLNGDSGFRR